MNIHDEIELTIDNLGINGEGVGKFNGFTVFVDGALPQERVVAQIHEKRTTFARAHMIKRLTSSPDRIKPICPLFGECGGCQIMHLDYSKQLSSKRQRIVDALQRIAKMDNEVLPCLPSPKPLAYRNKIQLPMSASGQLGLYARNSHDLVPIDKCFIHCPLGERAFQVIKSLTLPNDLKHVLIKTAVHSAQVLVVLVTESNAPPLSLAQQIFEAMPEIKGVVQNINPSSGNTILSSHYRTLVGQDAIEETLCGLRFKVSPASFFQVNPEQAETLYQKVMELAKLSGTERVLDAYCGVGTLSLICAHNAQEVIGIESVPEAIADAQANALLNDIHTVRFICGKVEEEIHRIDAIDVALINPPRKGCERSFLQELIKKRPRRLLYISCDPATLARDLQFLTHHGYTLHSVQPFDMFPQTMHVECLALLESR